MNVHSPPTNTSITEFDVANKHNNSTIMINSEDDNKSSLFEKNIYTHDSKTTQKHYPPIQLHIKISETL